MKRAKTEHDLISKDSVLAVVSVPKNGDAVLQSATLIKESNEESDEL